MIWWLRVLSVAGVLTSAYALIVRQKVLSSPSYSPVCDISDRISCSRAFGSEYSSTMGIPNPLAGVIYYSGLAVASVLDILTAYLFYLTLPALVFTFYLAYISYFKQRNFCLVCTFAYLINITQSWIAFSMM